MKKVFIIFNLSAVSKADITWSEPTSLSPESYNDAYRQYLGYYKGVLHVAWKDHSDILNSNSDWDIFYKYKPSGENWSRPVLVSTESTGVCSCPAIYVDSQNIIHLTWADTTPLKGSGVDSDIFYTHKAPNDDSWAPIELVSKGSNFDSLGPSIVVDNNLTVHIVWYEKNSKGSRDILYSYRSHGIWTDAEIVSENCTGNSVIPKISVDSRNNIHIIWNDNSNLFNNGRDYDIFYREKYANGGWSSIELVSKTSVSNCKWPTMYIDNYDNIHVAWCDQTSSGFNNGNHTGNDYDVVYTYKTSNTSWYPINLISKNSVYDSNWPQLVVDDNGTVHMFWWDDINDHWQLFYSYGKYSKDILKQEESENKTETPSFTITMLILTMLIYIMRWNLKRKEL